MGGTCLKSQHLRAKGKRIKKFNVFLACISSLRLAWAPKILVLFSFGVWFFEIGFLCVALEPVSADRTSTIPALHLRVAEKIWCSDHQILAQMLSVNHRLLAESVANNSWNLHC